MPATRSKRSHAGLYVRSMPTPGTAAFSRLFLFGPASVVSVFVATRTPSLYRSVTNGSICPWPIQRTARDIGSIAREVFHELVVLDTAVYQAIEATPTPLIDAPLRRLSNSANHAKLYMGIAALLFAVGGKKGRRAAVTGMAAVGLNSFVVNVPMKFAGHRPRPERGVVRFEEARHVKMPTSTSFPSGPLGLRLRLRRRRRRGDPGARRAAPRPRHRGRLLAHPLRRALPRGRHRRVARRHGRRRGHGARLARRAPTPPRRRR